MSRDLYTEKVCKGRVMQPHEAMFVGAAVGMIAAGMLLCVCVCSCVSVYACACIYI